MPVSRDHIPFLRKLPLFAGFRDEDMALFTARMDMLSLPKGAVIARAGEITDVFYVVVSGQARLEEPGPDGKITGFLSRGDAFGEMGLLTGETRPATAVVDSTCELLVLNKSDFDAVLGEAPHLAVPLSKLLATKLIEARGRTPATGLSARMTAIIGPAAPAVQAMVAATVAVLLVEQTRRRVLLLNLRDEDQNGRLHRALAVEPPKVGERTLHQDDLLNPDMIHRMCARHASGLDVMSLPRAMMEGRFGGLMYAFLHALRKSHDFIVIVPPDGGLCLKASMDEADRLLRVEDAAATTDRPADEDPRRVWSVRLETGQPAPLAPGTFRVPWGGVPADGPIPVTDQRARRALTRLARRLGGVSFGFAMGSGAAMGYVLIGFLKALERNGLYPDIISGTSMGALIGSFYAMGKTPAEIEEISRGITKAKIWSLMDFAFPFPRQGIMHGNEVLSFLKSILGPRTFAELDLPFACVATDILNGEEVVLRHGKVAEAVRASLSLPFFFKPFYLNGRYLVDGGLVDPVPTDVAAAMGADVLIAVNITTKPAEKRLPGFQRRQQRFSLVKGPNILQVMMKTIDTMQWGIARARQAPAHIVLEPDISAFTWADFHRAADITRTGEEYIETMMPKIKSFFPMFAAPPARPS